MLTPLGISAAEPLVLATVRWLPVGDPAVWVAVIGWWEVAIALLALQMVGTFLPLVVLPDVTFQPGRVVYGPSMEGQYIIKNLLIISAALVVGGTVRGGADRAGSAAEAAARH